jgi:hypothetical protein
MLDVAQSGDRIGAIQGEITSEPARTAFGPQKELDKVVGLFGTEDFISDSKLSGEFLLGYHCERAALWPPNSEEKQAVGLTAPEGEK